VLIRDLRPGEVVPSGRSGEAAADSALVSEPDDRPGTTTPEESTMSATAAIAAPNDTELAGLKQTAFMGESLRGSLMGGYQAWEVTDLVIGLGVAFTGLGAATLAVTGLTEASRRKIHVPDGLAAVVGTPTSGSPLM
jgi:hypothetical protein